MKAPLTFLCAVLCVAQLFSQNNTQIFLDFETAGSSDSTFVFGNYQLNGMQYMVASNPQKNHVNKSDKVVNYTKSHNATREAGFSMKIKEMYVPNTPYQVCFDYYSPTIGVCRFQMKNVDGDVNATMISKNKKVNQWETICATMHFYGPKNLDYTIAADKKTNHTFVLFPDDGKWGIGEDQQFYFDNLRINFGTKSKAVKFSVNMNGYTQECDYVFVSGSFNSWSGNTDTLYDDDKDGVWELEKRLFEEEIEYVYSVDSWKDKEYFTGHETCIASHPDGQGGFYRNRVMSLKRNTELPVVCFGSCYSCGESAQLSWNINMNGEEVSPDGVFLAGGEHFGHGKYEMKDEDGDGVYSIEIERELGFSSHYTFINGLCPSGWGCKENLVGQICGDTDHYSDRYLAPVSGDMRLDACFGYCSSEGLCEVDQLFNVTFNLDTRELDMSLPVYLAGNTINNWNSHSRVLNDLDDDGIYSITIPLPRGEHLFKFVHGKYWEDLSEADGCTVMDPSGVYINRYVVVEESDLMLDAVLFEQCNGYVSTEELEVQESFVQAYPTVTSEDIYLDFFGKGSSSAEVLIYNMSGRMVSEQSVDCNFDHRLDVSSYESGSYFMTIYSDHMKQTIQFIKI